jgi:hypothetical protein
MVIYVNSQVVHRYHTFLVYIHRSVINLKALTLDYPLEWTATVSLVFSIHKSDIHIIAVALAHSMRR